MKNWHSHEVYPHCPGQGASSRDTRRDLRTPRCATLIGQKGFPTGILLANSPAQRGRHRPCMQRIPVLHQTNPLATNPSASPSPSDHSHNMAVYRVGLRHGRATQEGTRRVHQMDRGKTDHHNRFQESSQVLPGHRLQVRRAQFHHHRQRNQLHRPLLPRVRGRIWDPNRLGIGRTPTHKRTS